MKKATAKRRRIGGGLALVGMLLLGYFACQLLRPAGPFDFLAGARPIPVPWPEEYDPAEAFYDSGNVYTLYNDFYAVPKDFATLRAQADRELLARGFQIRGRGRLSSYARPGSDGYANWEDLVELEADRKSYLDTTPGAYPIAWEDAPGWTSIRIHVAVRQSPQQAFVSRCKLWISERLSRFGKGQAPPIRPSGFGPPARPRG